MRQIPIELVGDVRSNPELIEPLRTGHGAEGAVAMMRQMYRQFPEALAPHLATLFRLFREDEVPVLVLCVVGKDRTGFTVAVILHALGVAPRRHGSSSASPSGTSPKRWSMRSSMRGRSI